MNAHVLDKLLTIVILDNSNYNEAPCGRPLGMAFDVLGDNLIVMHSFLGVFEVSLTTGEKKRLVSENERIGLEVSLF